MLVAVALERVASRDVKFASEEEPVTRRLRAESCVLTLKAPVVVALEKVALLVISVPAEKRPATVELPETKSAVVVAPVNVALVKVALVPWILVAMRRAFVEFQVKEELEERLDEDVQNATSVLLPEPVRLEPPTQVLPIAKQPVVSEIPFWEVLVAEPVRLI